MSRELFNINYIKFISFLLFLAALLTLSSSIVRPDGGEVYDIVNTRKKLEDISQESPDSLDVLFTGNSLVYRAVSPIQIYSEYGFTGYDLSDGAMRLCDQCSILQTSCSRQSPRLIVIEPCVLFSESNPHKDSYAHPTNFVEDVFPIFHYHTFYKAYMPNFLNTDYNDFDENDVDGMKGFQYSEKIEPYTGDTDYMKSDHVLDDEGIPAENTHYIKRLLSFCRKNDITLMIAAIPSPVNYDRSRHKELKKWADNYNIDFLDMNLLTDEIGIDWNTDTKDGGDHLNLNGSKKVTAYLGKYISKRYKLKSHRGDERYSGWTKAAEDCDLYN